MNWSVSTPAIALLLCAGPAVAEPADIQQEDLTVRMGDTVEMTINGQAVRFRIAPDAHSAPTLNADAASRLGLKPSMIGWLYIIGPINMFFKSDTVRYGDGDGSFRRRTSFSDRQFVVGADGIANPETFPFRRTIFILRDMQPQDRAITFPLDKSITHRHTSVRIDVDGRPIFASFSLDRAESLVTDVGGAGSPMQMPVASKAMSAKHRSFTARHDRSVTSSCSAR